MKMGTQLSSEIYQMWRRYMRVMQEQFGLGVDDAKHGFTVDELALVMAAFDTHPEAGK